VSAACTPAQPPDWSGQWENVGATPSPDGGFYEPLEQVLKELEWSPPLNAESQAVIDRVVAGQRAAVEAMRQGKDPGGAVTACTFGYPTVMLESPLMFEILPTRSETALIFSSREIRHVYTDGRVHPGKDDLWPTPWGDSIGHWEGETLVIETVGFNDKFWFDFQGHPHTTQLRTVERYTRTSMGKLENVTTIYDPGAYAKPFTVKFTATLRPGWELMEYICNENNQDVEHIRGKAGL
jgi:hypothetical protein